MVDKCLGQIFGIDQLNQLVNISQGVNTFLAYQVVLEQTHSD